MTMRDDMPQLFASCGLRCTRQRKAIYDALAASRQHPTADELFRLVTGDADGQGSNADAAGVSLATVYNTLEAFCQAGLAHKLPGAGENGSSRYDAVRGNHLHMRCEKTGAVADVPDALGQRVLNHIPARILADLEAELGFKVNHVQIELVGRFDAEPEAA